MCKTLGYDKGSRCDKTHSVLDVFWQLTRFVDRLNYRLCRENQIPTSVRFFCVFLTKLDVDFIQAHFSRNGWIVILFYLLYFNDNVNFYDNYEYLTITKILKYGEVCSF